MVDIHKIISDVILNEQDVIERFYKECNINDIPKCSQLFITLVSKDNKTHIYRIYNADVIKFKFNNIKS